MSGSDRVQDLRLLDDEEQNACRLGQIKTMDVTDLLHKRRVVGNHRQAGCRKGGLSQYGYTKKISSQHLSISYRKWKPFGLGKPCQYNQSRSATRCEAIGRHALQSLVGKLSETCHLHLLGYCLEAARRDVSPITALDSAYATCL